MNIWYQLSPGQLDQNIICLFEVQDEDFVPNFTKGQCCSTVTQSDKVFQCLGRHILSPECPFKNISQIFVWSVLFMWLRSLWRSILHIRLSIYVPRFITQHALQIVQHPYRGKFVICVTGTQILFYFL